MDRKNTMLNNKQLVSIFLIVFIDMLGFSIILPLLPFYAENFGASPSSIGFLTASYAAAQLIGAPILGRLSDRLGRKPILLISILGTSLGFILLGFAQTLPLLFAARILDGLTGGNISVAQAYISDITTRENRAKGMGLIGAAFGLGFILGPALGGLLSRFGYSVPAFAGAAVAFLNFLLVAFWLRESLTEQRRKEISQNKKPPFTIPALLEVLSRPVVGRLLHTRFFFGLAFSMFQSVFSLYAIYRFKLNSQQVGYILAYVGLLSVIVQGVLIGRLTLRFTENILILSGIILMAASLFGWAFSPNVAILLVILAPTALAGGVLNTVINSTISKSIAPSEVGGILGISASLESLTRVIAPSLGGVMLEKLGTSAPGIFSGVILVWLAAYVWWYISRKQAINSTVPQVVR